MPKSHLFLFPVISFDFPPLLIPLLRSSSSSSSCSASFVIDFRVLSSGDRLPAKVTWLSAKFFSERYRGFDELTALPRGRTEPSSADWVRRRTLLIMAMAPYSTNLTLDRAKQARPVAV